jgi:F-type H+-transporting ATPase subunit gamma
MASMKDIRRRIKGIKSTGKITRAMEMISAVKMRKAVEAVLAIRPYAQSALTVLSAVSRTLQKQNHPLVLSDGQPQKDPAKERILIVTLTSNRGLCGSFNAQVARQVRAFCAGLPETATVSFLSIGKKGDQFLAHFPRGRLTASYPDLAANPSMEGTLAVMAQIIDGYLHDEFDRAVLINMNYVSAMVQKIQTRQLLPVIPAGLYQELTDLMQEGIENPPEISLEPLSGEYAIEPDPATVIEVLVPRLLEIQLYHALRESQASEEAARMMAMRAATDATKEMAYEFSLTYNQLRHAKVTQEIAELSASMVALGN